MQTIAADFAEAAHDENFPFVDSRFRENERKSFKI
jgi:hypothetical protein